MQIVIEIPSSVYHEAIRGNLSPNSIGIQVLRNGIPLPNNHGRLVDETSIGGAEWHSSTRKFTVNAPTLVPPREEKVWE